MDVFGLINPQIYSFKKEVRCLTHENKGAAEEAAEAAKQTWMLNDLFWLRALDPTMAFALFSCHFKILFNFKLLY